MTGSAAARAGVPVWVWVVAAFGIAWNVFGLVQLADFIAQTRASLIMGGMSAPAADLYCSLPGWMKIVFAVGSVGGLLGSLALAARRRVAVPIFATSLAGYIALYAGDLAHGVFDVIPGQLAVLSLVVAIAILLLGASIVARRSAILVDGE